MKWKQTSETRYRAHASRRVGGVYEIRRYSSALERAAVIALEEMSCLYLNDDHRHRYSALPRGEFNYFEIMHLTCVGRIDGKHRWRQRLLKSAATLQDALAIAEADHLEQQSFPGAVNTFIDIAEGVVSGALGVNEAKAATRALTATVQPSDPAQP
jgi:hypothetical protein